MTKVGGSAGTRRPSTPAWPRPGRTACSLRNRTAVLDAGAPVSRKDRSRSIVLSIVDEADGEITVGGVAEQLAVDPSVASRLVSECIKDGLLVRKASQQDGRGSVLELSAAGLELRDRIASRQRQAFEKITQDWPEAKRLAFAQMLIDYADAAAALTNQARHQQH